MEKNDIRKQKMKSNKRNRKQTKSLTHPNQEIGRESNIIGLWKQESRKWY